MSFSKIVGSLESVRWWGFWNSGDHDLNSLGKKYVLCFAAMSVIDASLQQDEDHRWIDSRKPTVL